jgi:immune inhibitor A
MSAVSGMVLQAQEHCVMIPPGGKPFNAKEPLLQLRGEVRFRSDKASLVTTDGAHRVAGTWQALVILIDFPDYPWYYQDDINFPNSDSLYVPAHFDSMLFSTGSFRHPGSSSSYTGSMRDFYRENSYGLFDLEGVVTQWYTAAQPLSYYANDNAGRGSYPTSSRGLVEEAVLLADADVDYSRFDNDGNGIVDALFIVHAGPGAEEIYTSNFPEHVNYLWSLKSQLSSELVLDGVKVYPFTLEPENGAIGVFCHEFGHALGLPDLYDRDGSSEGIGEWGLMGSGSWCHDTGDPLGTSPSHFSAWSKQRLGWLEPVVVTENLVDVSIPPVETEAIAYRLWFNGSSGYEYFLIENRQNIGFDVGLTRRQKNFGLPDANGLLIWHIDENAGQSNDQRRKVDVEEASPLFTVTEPIFQLDLPRDLSLYQYLTYGNRGDDGDPFPGYSLFNADSSAFTGERNRDQFSAVTMPNSNDNNGFPTEVTVRNIRVSGLDIIADLEVNAPTSIATADLLPEFFELYQNYPNPFNQSTIIRYQLPVSAHIELVVYSVTGQKVAELVSDQKPAGSYHYLWRAEGLASGVYYYRLSAGQFVQVRKLALIK